jgi:hypothetical protein
MLGIFLFSIAAGCSFAWLFLGGINYIYNYKHKKEQK